MALIKVNGNTYQGIDQVKFGNNNGHVVMTLKHLSGQIEYQELNAAKLRIEVKGNVGAAEIENCLYVKGDIKNANIHNVLAVEGFVHEYENWRGIEVRKDININAEIARTLKISGKDETRFTVVHINGYLSLLNVNVSKIAVIPIIEGSLFKLSCGNCAFVKGNVGKCVVGNCIQATMGTKLSKAEKNRMTLLEKERKEQTKEIINTIDNIFKRNHQ